MEDALKSAEATMRKQEARHKADIDARDAELEKLKEENWDLLAKNKDLESKAKEVDEELQGLRNMEGAIVKDLAKVCLSLRTKIIVESKV
ncbi:hypothetical protein JCGZ_10352 [Jatropha curcas]|uniref:Uncharacterized protein n=1 Tax=Jatropha curcas TaxID=180498 RepID=A0A067KK51_JATCU|nr:hypothetical protein JCGZ_10352 [Jatropha curcas]